MVRFGGGDFQEGAQALQPMQSKHGGRERAVRPKGGLHIWCQKRDSEAAILAAPAVLAYIYAVAPDVAKPLDDERLVLHSQGHVKLPHPLLNSIQGEVTRARAKKPLGRAAGAPCSGCPACCSGQLQIEGK